MSRMLGRANGAGVVVYTIDARGLAAGGLAAEDDPQRYQTGNAGSYDAGQHVRDLQESYARYLLESQESMQFIATQTGGLAITNTNDLNLGISRVLRDQDGYYLLGNVAPKGAPRSGWDQDRVKVRVKRSGLRVRARQGFFGPSDPNEPSGFGFDPLTMAALSPFASSGVTVRLTSLFGHDAKNGPYVRSMLFIDAADLQWGEGTPGRHTARLQVNMLAIGENGQVLAEWRRLVPVALDAEQFRLALERGILYSVRTPIKQPGAYQMRAAVRDANTTMVGSASQYIEVPKVGNGKLALSGVLLKGVAGPEDASAPPTVNDAARAGLADAVLLEPQVRVLEPGTEAVYAYEIYDGLKPADADSLQMATALLRAGRVVYQSAFAAVTTPARQGGKVRAIPIAGKLALGPNMPAGPYTLEVIVRGKTGRNTNGANGSISRCGGNGGYNRCVAAAAIEFSSVTFSRPGRRILDGVSFSVPSGETLALVGRSGAGKSTILKLINRLLAPDAGTIRVSGRDAQAWDRYDLRRHAGYVLQEIGLFPHLTVGENVGIVPRLLAWPDERIRTRSDDLLASSACVRRSSATDGPMSSPAGSGSVWALRARWPPTHPCCSWTSLSVRSIRSPERSSAASSGRIQAAAAEDGPDRDARHVRSLRARRLGRRARRGHPDRVGHRRGDRAVARPPSAAPARRGRDPRVRLPRVLADARVRARPPRGAARGAGRALHGGAR